MATQDVSRKRSAPDDSTETTAGPNNLVQGSSTGSESSNKRSKRNSHVATVDGPEGAPRQTADPTLGNSAVLKKASKLMSDTAEDIFTMADRTNEFARGVAEDLTDPFDLEAMVGYKIRELAKKEAIKQINKHGWDELSLDVIDEALDAGRFDTALRKLVDRIFMEEVKKLIFEHIKKHMRGQL